MKYFLRIASALCFLLGVALVAFALADYVSTVGAMQGPPTRFGLFFVGFPLIAVGGILLSLSAAHKTRMHGVQAPQSTANRGDFCPYCGQAAKPEASYCEHCGKSLR